MNKLLPFLLTAFLFAISFDVKAQDYTNTIADETCGCINTLVNSGEKQNLDFRLGACLIKAAEPYQKQLKKDYGIDFANITDNAEKLGEVLGVKLAARCPDTFMAIMQLMEENKKGDMAVTEKLFEGTVTGVNDQQFIVITVKDESGKSSNFYWLSFFNSDLNLNSGYKNIKDKKVKVAYKEEEYFDPRINEYKKFNVITSMHSLN